LSSSSLLLAALGGEPHVLLRFVVYVWAKDVGVDIVALGIEE
jgi:hypothetical protein